MELIVKMHLNRAMGHISSAINANCDNSKRQGDKELGERLRKIDAELDEVFEDFDE